MHPTDLVIEEADLNHPEAATAYREQLQRYAQDPMGGGEPLSTEVLHRVVGDLGKMPQAHVFLARQQGTPVGFATCFEAYSTFRARPLWNIHDLAVIPEARGQGIGRCLLGEIAQRARQAGCCKLTLEVREDNPVATGLYLGEGFTTAAIQDTMVQYLFLEKSLT